MKKAAAIFLPLVACVAFAAAAADKTTAFGTTQRSESALIGILYDFKQNQKHERLPMDRMMFQQEVAKFIDADWDEGLLNKYYRVPRALYTTELMINMINADTAPKAFGVEKTVEPRTWMVHYKGQVAPPEDGIYRFLGDADDFVAVAVNGKTVLVDFHPGSKLPVKWFPKESVGDKPTAGDWFEAKAGKPIDLDIITGESPGGGFKCKLFLEKKGVAYKKRRPTFQLSATKDTPPDILPWKGVQ